MSSHCLATRIVIVRIFLSLLIALLLSLSGSFASNEEENACLITGVPFFPQEQKQCGPAALAGVLNYWGTKIAPEEIAKEIYSETAGGTLWIDLTLYARDKGYSAMQYIGSWNDLMQNIQAGFPLIVLVDHGVSSFQVNHFMVVVGYTKDGVIVNSGMEREKIQKKRRFLKAWKKNQYWTLLIRPEKTLFEIRSK